MVGTTESLDALKSIGLNLYERKIFVALLAKGVATAAEVSEIASVPRSRSYDVLESLADKGF
ncbi:MAG: TrmB family transcriptional regulator, partial [Candidatus Aenigmarchaeota archaeon]|nr:TrmB family transcriptional regulator [Candidatus Aenigmarchaeota archaeon]